MDIKTRDKSGKFIKGIHPSPKTEFKKGKCYRENNISWKGGRRLNERGYVLIRLPDYMKNGYGYEHRIVIETSLKRKLNPKEVVHHINGNRQDNRIENLLVTTQGSHLKLHKEKRRNSGNNNFLYQAF